MLVHCDSKCAPIHWWAYPLLTVTLHTRAEVTRWCPSNACAAAGVLVFRNTPATLQLLAAWRLYLSNPVQASATSGEDRVHGFLCQPHLSEQFARNPVRHLLPSMLLAHHCLQHLLFLLEVVTRPSHAEAADEKALKLLLGLKLTPIHVNTFMRCCTQDLPPQTRHACCHVVPDTLVGSSVALRGIIIG